MATVTATTLIDRALLILQDSSAIRWSRTELLGWLNDGARELVALRPDAAARRVTISLHEGTRQSIPLDGYALVEVVRNIDTGPCRGTNAIRKVSMALLDAQSPDWHTHTTSGTVTEYVFDIRTPKFFYVYPPATEGTLVEVVYAVAPSVLTSEGSNVIPVDDIYANALLDYMLYRALSKETEPSLQEKAVLYRQSFENTLGIKTAGDTSNVTRSA